MLVIRLARTGKKHQAYFRVVVADSKRAVSAKFIEILGNYDPHAKKISIDKEKTLKHFANGAQPSTAVAKLLVKEGLELPKWVKIVEKKKNPKKPASPAGGEPVVKEAPKAEAPAEGSELAESNEDSEQVEESVPSTEEEASTEGEAVESNEAAGEPAKEEAKEEVVETAKEEDNSTEDQPAEAPQEDAAEEK